SQKADATRRKAESDAESAKMALLLILLLIGGVVALFALFFSRPGGSGAIATAGGTERAAIRRGPMIAPRPDEPAPVPAESSVGPAGNTVDPAGNQAAIKQRIDPTLSSAPPTAQGRNDQ